MPTRSQVCAWIAGFGLLLPTPAVAQDRTEREIVEAIVREGPLARTLSATVEVVRREQLARLNYPNPAVSYAREGAGFTEFLQVEQALPISGVRSALARAGVAANEAAAADHDARLWALRAEASAIVGRAVAADARLTVAGAYTAEIRRLLDILRTREREGEGSRFDRLRAEHELKEAQLTEMTAAIDVADARASLTSLLPSEFTVGRITGVATPRPPPVVETLMSRALLGRADLRALVRSATRAGFEADAARRSRMPSPLVMGGLKRSDSEGRREAGGVFGVSVSLPVFDTGGRDIARWSAERDRIDADRAALEQQIRNEIVRAAASLARRQALMTDAGSTSDNELSSIAEVAFREGEIGIFELLDAARAATRARLRVVEMQLDLRLAEIALERAVGEVLWP